ncbi:MAG TPA: hypothetical protein VFP55_12845, partial [Solirubrobacteraceae bacterium]|nr:hypothetical protein [Solirubrobacteraceae bacterium]
MGTEVRIIGRRAGVVSPRRALAELRSAGMRVALLAALFTLGSVPLPSAGAAQTTATPRAYALIDVTVASMWTRPTGPRPVDRPSLTNPVNLYGWLGALTTAQRVWLTNHLIDQGLYGQQVAIWKQRGAWDRISLTGQATRSGLTLPGWVPARQLTTPTPATAGATQPPPSGPQAVVAVRRTWLYAQTTGGSRGRRLLHLSFDTRLPEVGHSPDGRWTIVQTPAGTDALLASSAVVIRNPATPPPPPTGRQLVRKASMFLGLPYLWAGT